jgi:type IV pilus assembly protein PilX
MKSIKFKEQSGVVLFVTLIALVVMSLAAAALIRSVDTNTLITGNLSFKQSAVVSSDRGLEAALAWVQVTAANADKTLLNTPSAANGYFPTFDTLNLDDPTILKSDNTWANNSANAVGSGIAGGIEAVSQNRIRYITQRMCRSPAAAPDMETCQVGFSRPNVNSQGGLDYSNNEEPPVTAPSPLYRVTVRVDGPKNTVAYTQTYVY